MERDVAHNSGMIVRARRKGTVTLRRRRRGSKSAATPIRCASSSASTSGPARIRSRSSQVGQKVEKGEPIADGAATFQGELALGRNVLVGFMAWDGFNFEDAIIISEELVKNDIYTSIHIEEFDIEIRETKLGREEFTRDIPNVSEKALRNLDESGIVRIGTYVRPGDILVGKVSPKSKTELTPEEKLLHAIFGRAGEDVKNDSLDVPSGVEGIVIDTQKFSRRMSLSEDERKVFEKALKEAENEGAAKIADRLPGDGRRDRGDPAAPAGRRRGDRAGPRPGATSTSPSRPRGSSSTRSTSAARSARPTWKRSTRPTGRPSKPTIDDRDRKLNSMKRGDELRSGVLQMVKVYVAAKRVISVGDKMAGRHGNKGVIAKILPVEDMPFLADGTSLQILLNPLGVPSRMNVGQILETHLGWAGAKLGFQAITPVFDGATEKTIQETLDRGRLAAARQGPAVRRPHRRAVRAGNDGRLHLHAQAASPGRRQGACPLDRPLLAHHAAAAGRQGPLRRPAVWGNGSLGARGLRRGLRAAGVAHRQERRRRRPHQDLRIDGQGRKHARSRHPGQLRRAHQRNPRSGAEHAIGKATHLTRRRAGGRRRPQLPH